MKVSREAKQLKKGTKTPFKVAFDMLSGGATIEMTSKATGIYGKDIREILTKFVIPYTTHKVLGSKQEPYFEGEEINPPKYTACQLIGEELLIFNNL